MLIGAFDPVNSWKCEKFVGVHTWIKVPSHSVSRLIRNSLGYPKISLRSRNCVRLKSARLGTSRREGGITNEGRSSLPYSRDARSCARPFSLCRRGGSRRMAMFRNSGQRMQPVWQSPADLCEQSGADVYRCDNAGAGG